MRLLFLTAIICLLVSNVVHAQTNLVANPGFEDGNSLSLPWNAGNVGPEMLLGDVNRDGEVDFLDIPFFIDLLVAGQYQFEADVNQDGEADFSDIPDFIQLLVDDGSVECTPGSIGIAGNSDDVFEGNQVAVVDHGTCHRTSGFSQLVPVVAGRSYIFSASVFSENGSGQARLVVRTDGEDEAELVNQFFPATPQVWEKAQVRFTADVTGDVRIFLRSEQSNGNTYFDAVKLFEVDGDSNLIANQDFEDDGDWNLQSGATYFNADSLDAAGKVRFGGRSLRLGSSSNSYAAQNVRIQTLGADQPIYTLSAHIMTDGTVPAPITNINWASKDEVDPRFTEVPGRGAAFRVNFFDGSRPLETRTIYSPFFFSQATVFTERKFSFLPPEEATSFNVTLLAIGSNFQAYFDNVQLRSWKVSDGDTNFVDMENVGIAEVEAPEAGTYVAVDPSLVIQSVVDRVTETSDPDYGKLVWVGRGDYMQPDVLLRSTTHLKLHKDARLIKSEDTGDSQWFGASVKSGPNGRDVEGIAISDVIVEGGTIDNNNGVEDFPGSAVAIFGDRVVVRNVNIPHFSRTSPRFTGTPADRDNDRLPLHTASAIYLMGHHTYVYNNFISGPRQILGQDAIHLWGGTHSHIMSNRVLGGDDGLGLFTVTNPTFTSTGEPIASFDRDIRYVEAYNNIFDSVGARCVALGHANPRTVNTRLISTVSDIRIRNFIGVSGGIHPLLHVQNRIERGADSDFVQTDSQVFNILLQNASLEGYEYPLPNIEDPIHPGYLGGSLEELPRLPPFGLRVLTSGVGSVKNVTFENITVNNFEDDIVVGEDGVERLVSAVVDVSKTPSSPDNEGIEFIDCILGLLEDDGSVANDALYAFRIFGVVGVEVNDIEASNEINSRGIRSYRN